MSNIKMCQDINESTYNNVVLYFIKYCNNKFLHATKLNKLLYYLDFISFRDHKKSDIFANKIKKKIKDSTVKNISADIGSVNQLSNSVDLLENDKLLKKLKILYL